MRLPPDKRLPHLFQNEAVCYEIIGWFVTARLQKSVDWDYRRRLQTYPTETFGLQGHVSVACSRTRNGRCSNLAGGHTAPQQPRLAWKKTHRVLGNIPQFCAMPMGGHDSADGMGIRAQ